VSHDVAVVGAVARRRPTAELGAAIAFLTRIPVGAAGDSQATTDRKSVV